MSPSFGQYRLVRRIGEGGMAEVWSAQRATLGGPMRCAVKLIRADRAREPGYREMFLREGRLALSLSGHGNVVSVFDVGEHDGRLYLAMEEVDGVTLGALARRLDVPWPVEHAVYVVAAVLRALAHIHGYEVGGVRRGIVHRDVTPHNVMVSSTGEIKLMDFGIALPADASPSLSDALGKLSYVPREQVAGEADERSDLYAAGAILFELLDGRPFRWHCADEDALFQEIHRERAPRLRRTDVPEAVHAVLQGLLQPDRTHRIADATTALRMLEAWPGFRWAQSELEVLYRGVIDRPHSGRTGMVEAVIEDDAPLPRVTSGARSGVADSSAAQSRAVTSSAPQTAWRAANDSGRRARARLRDDAPTTLHSGARARRPSEHTTEPAPACVTRPDDAELEPTRVLPQAEQPGFGHDPSGLVTRTHPAGRARAESTEGAPQVRQAMEIAVTRPTPSARAPWSADTDPLVRKLRRSEPGAPQRRRRAHSGDLREESSGSVAPRARQSASMHRVATSGMRTHEATGEVVAGEIVADEDEPGDPVWRVGSR